jgi:uncharacterized membrane protein YkvA (DUF1232 family)
MRDFDQLLADDLEGYLGRSEDLIFYAPALFRLLTGVLEDPLLPARLRPLVLSAIGYFVLPVDVISDKHAGPEGYGDDIFVAAFVAQRLLAETGREELLRASWDAERAVVPLIESILEREAELIGDRRPAILAFIGYEP